MTAYLTVAEYKTRSVLPAEYIDALELNAPGFVAAQLESGSRVDIDALLRKRYDAPFTTAPETVKTWLARLTDVAVLNRRGVDATDLNYQFYEATATRTREDILRAANAVDGLYDLPLRDSEKATGISKGGTRSYSEQSPYAAFDGQRRVGRGEDWNGGGTRG